MLLSMVFHNAFTHMHGCKTINLLTCAPSQQLISGKRKTVHCQYEPNVFCSMRCRSETGVRGNRELLSSMHYHLCCCHGAAESILQLKQKDIIQVRESGLAEWKGAETYGQGGDGMHEWQQRCSFLSAHSNVCYMSNISTYAKGRCSQES